MDEYTIKRRIRKVREAYNRGDIESIKFDNDGSGMEVKYTDPVGDHGCPCQMYASFGIEDAIKIVAGMRLKIGDIPTTLKIDK